MIEDPTTKIARPRQIYTGPPARDYVADREALSPASAAAFSRLDGRAAASRAADARRASRPPSIHSMIARHRNGPNGRRAAMSPRPGARRRAGRPRAPVAPRRRPAPPPAAAPRGRARTASGSSILPSTRRRTTAPAVACTAPREEREHGSRPAEPGAREHDELRVAEAHARPPAERLVADDERAARRPRSRPTAPRNASAHVRPRSPGVARPNRVPPMRDRVRQVHVRGVDERGRHERHREREVGEEERGRVHEGRARPEAGGRRARRWRRRCTPPRTSTAT